MYKENRDRDFEKTLKHELVPALGCTEPIAIAYASAKAREVLKLEPERIEILCSSNIVKNVKSVLVPNSGGLRGIEIAAILGLVGGNAEEALEVLQSITDEHRAQARKLLDEGFASYSIAEGVANLYISATVYKGNHYARVTIVNHHTNISEIVRDDELIFKGGEEECEECSDWSLWSVREILDYADNADISGIKDVLERQISINSSISREGLETAYGAEVGRSLLESGEDCVRNRAKARAAAGSDARMGGCCMPVIINSGSGNQGLTVSMPVIEYAAELKVSHEKLLRALLVSNLLSIYQKHYIGSLSAFCGAATAACGAGAAITYMSGGDYEAVCRTITNTMANVGGIICDGAKSSCAAKIAVCVDAAISAHIMSMKGREFRPGEGIVKSDVEDTIRSVGYVGRVGMKQTDKEVLSLMMDHVNLS